MNDLIIHILETLNTLGAMTPATLLPHALAEDPELDLDQLEDVLWMMKEDGDIDRDEPTNTWDIA